MFGIPFPCCDKGTCSCIVMRLNWVVQLNMGEGKTRVILPMEALELCGRGDVVRLNFLSQLLPEAVDFLHACLTGTTSTRLRLFNPFNALLCSLSEMPPDIVPQVHLTGSLLCCVENAC